MIRGRERGGGLTDLEEVQPLEGVGRQGKDEVGEGEGALPFEGPEVGVLVLERLDVDDLEELDVVLAGEVEPGPG